MNFGFSTFFFIKKPISEVIDEIIAHGIKTIELTLEIPHGPNMDDKFVKKIAELSKNGVGFSLHAPFFEMNLGSHHPEIRRFSKKRVREAIDMAYAMGADPVVLHPGYTFWMGKINSLVEKSWEYFVQDTRELLLYGKKKNVTIALEAVPMHFFFFYDLPDFKRLQEVLPDLGMTLDIGHAYLTKIAKKVQDPEGAIIEELRDLGVHSVSHVHLHNNRGKRDEHLFPDGRINIKRILDFLKNEGYAGKVIIESYEIENNGIPSVLEKLETLTS